MYCVYSLVQVIIWNLDPVFCYRLEVFKQWSNLLVQVSLRNTETDVNSRRCIYLFFVSSLKPFLLYFYWKQWIVLCICVRENEWDLIHGQA